MTMLANLIDGTGQPPTGKTSLSLRDPATGLTTVTFTESSAEDVEIAVRGARSALPSWAALGPHARAEILQQSVKNALEEVDELARLQCTEMGQPWALARPLVEQALNGVAQCAIAAADYPFHTALESVASQTSVVRVPRGVGALITPWNFPLPVALDGLATLLAGGNTVVWKPSEHSPLSAVRVAELFNLPSGVLNVVVGGGSTGRYLAGNSNVDMVVFTGSIAAGTEIAQECAKRMVPTLMELGGKDPVVIDDDVDPEWAAATVAHGAFWNSGQVCTSMERIYVHASIAERFVEALCEEARALVVGPPLEPKTQMGPLVHEQAIKHVEEQIADALSKGAHLLVGGERDPGPGSYFPPTVLTNVAPGMLLHDVETFGPVASVTVVESFEAGLSLAATTAYGLCATLLTGRAEHARRGLDLPAAVCWINEWQGGAPGAVYEPARMSGIGMAGSLDTVTRPMMIHDAPLPERGRAGTPR